MIWCTRDARLSQRTVWLQYAFLNAVNNRLSASVLMAIKRREFSIKNLESLRRSRLGSKSRRFCMSADIPAKYKKRSQSQDNIPIFLAAPMFGNTYLGIFGLNAVALQCASLFQGHRSSGTGPTNYKFCRCAYSIVGGGSRTKSGNFMPRRRIGCLAQEIS